VASRDDERTAGERSRTHSRAKTTAAYVSNLDLPFVGIIDLIAEIEGKRSLFHTLGSHCAFLRARVSALSFAILRRPGWEDLGAIGVQNEVRRGEVWNSLRCKGTESARLGVYPRAGIRRSRVQIATPHFQLVCMPTGERWGNNKRQTPFEAALNDVHDDIWLASFMDYDLGYFDLETRVLEPLDNPFGPRLLPM
jgi:hypothetical protein